MTAAADNWPNDEVALQEVLDFLQAHVCVLDNEGTIVHVNRAWRVFALENGAPGVTWEGTSYLRVVERSAQDGGAEAEEALRGLRRLLEGTQTRFSLEYPCHSPDEERWFLMRAQRLRKSDRIVTAHLNITRSIRAEAAVSSAKGRLKDMETRAIEEARLSHAERLRSLGILAGGVAHEINNTLAVVLGISSTMLQAWGANDSAAEDLEQIVAACRRGRNLVRSLLAFAHREPVEARPVSTRELLRDVVRLLDATADSDVSVSLYLPDDDCLVMGDPTRLSQAVVNLGLNAIHASNERGRVKIELEPVTLHVGDVPEERQPGKYARVRVRDRGTGMVDDVLAQAIDPFFTTKQVGEGTGLGLSMVSATADQHGGWLKLHSEVGVGTTACLFLPIQSTLRERVTDPQRGAAPLEGDRVLVVDDDEPVRTMLTRSLTALGFSVTAVAGGREALDLLKDVNFSVIVLDLKMPGMSGSEVLRRIRADSPSQKILVVSGFGQLDLSLLDDNTDFLEKPFHMLELRVKLKALVGE